MSTKKRAAIAAVLSAAAGSTAGAVASYCGLDIEQSVKLGAVVSGAVGKLLYDALRLTPDPTDETAVSGTPDSADNAEPDRHNAREAASDTVNPTDETDPQVRPRHRSARGSTEGGKRDRHRKLRRAGRRRLDRDPSQERDTHRDGADHGTA